MPRSFLPLLLAVSVFAAEPKPFVLPPKLELYTMPVAHVQATSPDGTLFATGDMAGATVWRFGEKRPLAQVSWPLAGAQWGGVTPLAFSNDNTLIFLARKRDNDTFELAVADVAEEEIVVALPPRAQRCSPPGWVGIGRCEPLGEAYFSEDGTRTFYRAHYDAAGHRAATEDIEFGRDGKILSTKTSYRTYHEKHPMIWLDEKGGHQSLCQEKGGSYVTLRRDPASCSIIDCASGKRMAFIDECDGGRYNRLRFSGDGSRIVGEEAYGYRASVWETATGKLIRTFEPKDDAPYRRGHTGVALDAGGRFAVEKLEYVGEARVKAVRFDLLDVDSGKLLGRLESAVDASPTLSAVAPDGSAAYTFAENVLSVWRFGPPRAVPARAPIAIAASKSKAQSAAAAPAVDVDTPPKTGAKPDPNAFAVVVGVEKYRQEGIPAVNYAARDAQAVYAHLTQAMGFDPKNVVTLTDGQATKTDFDKHFGKWLKNRVDAKSRVFVYYAGHGAPNPATGEGFLMPYEADPAYLEETAYPVAKLYAELAKLPAKDVTVVLDACFSGQGQRSLVAQGTRPLVNVAPAKAPSGLLVIAAASGAQISASDHAAKHGLLTYHLLAGLKGGADADKDGAITAGEAFAYARPAVERAARLQNVEQTPTMAGAASGRPWIAGAER